MFGNFFSIQDVFLLETPGGGGWGCPDNQQKQTDNTRDRTRDTPRDDMPAKLRRVEVRGSVAEYTRNQESA